jgi:uncharacterized protein (DUF983 family)
MSVFAKQLSLGVIYLAGVAVMMSLPALRTWPGWIQGTLAIAWLGLLVYCILRITCPKCGKRPFFSGPARYNPLSPRCTSCGLSIFESVRAA